MPFAFNLFCITLICCTVSAQEWTRFRGPNGSGIPTTKTPSIDISESGLAWKTGLPGSGHSSPVLWGDRLFLTCTGDKSGGISVLSLNAINGKILWERDFTLSPFAKHSLNSFASATPATDSERVYVVWNEPDHYLLTALDHGGKTVWQRDLGPFISQHASGASPIVFEGKVILPNWQDDPKHIEGPKPDARIGKSSIIAMDARTGKTVWETPRQSTVVSYSTPCVFEQAGHRALIFNSQSHGISALDPNTGKVLWEYEHAFDKRTVSSPVIAGNVILGSCGSGGGGNYVVAIHPPDATTNQPQLAYQIKKAAAYVPTALAKGDLAWLWSDGGIVTCFSPSTGEIKYQERAGGNYFGSPVLLNDQLLCVSKTGEIVAIDASDKFNITHRFPLNEVCESTPAIALGHVFIRTASHLWSFGPKVSP